MDSIVICRDELYKQVWDEPTREVAKLYGISDKAVEKICKKLNVPKPPRGYWAKLKEGKKAPKKPDLPKLKHGEPKRHVIEKRVSVKAGVPPADPEMDHFEALIHEMLPIIVPKRVQKYHPMVVKTRDFLKDAPTDEYQVYHVKKAGFVSLRISPKQLSRALRLLDCLFKTVEGKLGCSFDWEESYWHPSIRLYFGDEGIPFKIEEDVKRIQPDEGHKPKPRPDWYYTRQEFAPTGKLKLFFSPPGFKTNGMRKTWTDRKDRPLEDQLGDFLLGGVKLARVMKVERLEKEAEEKAKEIERHRQAELARLQAVEDRRIALLTEVVGTWNQCQKIKEFMEAVQTKVATLSPDSAEYGRAKEWLVWASKYLASQDPFVEWQFLNDWKDAEEVKPKETWQTGWRY